MPFTWGSFALLLLACTGYALPSHSHGSHSALPGTWFHPPDHPVHALFRRQNGTDLSTDGMNYPPVGSPSMFLCDLTSAFVLTLVFHL